MKPKGYDRWYRTVRMKMLNCGCGQRAVRYSIGGPVCARCDAIEKAMAHSELRVVERRVALERIWVREKKDNATLFEEEQNLTHGKGWGSLERLEQRLQAS